MFNTLRYAKKLEESGIDRQQAEAHVQIIAEIVEGDLATKKDLKELEYRLTFKLGAISTVALATIATIMKII